VGSSSVLDGDDDIHIKMENGSETEENHDTTAEETPVIFKHDNPGVVVTTYVDTDQLEKVLLVWLLPSGSTDQEMKVSEDGCNLTLKCTWPTAMSGAADLFKLWKADKLHPRVAAVTAALKEIRPTFEGSIYESISVKLPCKVLTDSAHCHYVLDGKRSDGTKILVGEFTGAHSTGVASLLAPKTISI
jgi:hypothetical protein